jgi:hypothetical protein
MGFYITAFFKLLNCNKSAGTSVVAKPRIQYFNTDTKSTTGHDPEPFLPTFRHERKYETVVNQL